MQNYLVAESYLRTAYDSGCYNPICLRGYVQLLLATGAKRSRAKAAFAVAEPGTRRRRAHPLARRGFNRRRPWSPSARLSKNPTGGSTPRPSRWLPTSSQPSRSPSRNAARGVFSRLWSFWLAVDPLWKAKLFADPGAGTKGIASHGMAASPPIALARLMRPLSGTGRIRGAKTDFALPPSDVDHGTKKTEGVQAAPS